MTTVLREADVERLIEMHPILAAVERAAVELGQGVAQNQPRRRVFPPGNLLNVMFASFPGSGYYGFKSYSVGGGKARFLVGLYAQEGERAGMLEALIEANLLGAYRTGAATGVAARALAPAGPVEVGVIGTGFQARTQIIALSLALPVTRFRVYSRESDRREAFAAELREHFGLAVEAAASVEEVVRGAPVVVAITPSATPVLEASWVAPGALVVGAGTNQPQRAELPPDLVARAELVVVDQLEAARLESGDLIAAEASGHFDFDQAVELGAILAGAERGRRSAEGIVLFESHGLALWDVAAGAHVLAEARRTRAGQEVDLFSD